jgi:hypothetical protein
MKMKTQSYLQRNGEGRSQGGEDVDADEDENFNSEASWLRYILCFDIEVGLDVTSDSLPSHVCQS